MTNMYRVTRKSRNISRKVIMTSENGNIFRVTGPWCGEFTGHGWIPRTKASHAKLWCFVWSAPWINGWVNTREAGDLSHHRALYDVIVMLITAWKWFETPIISLLPKFNQWVGLVFAWCASRQTDQFCLDEILFIWYKYESAVYSD